MVMLFVHLPSALTPEPPTTPDGDSLLINDRGEAVSPRTESRWDWDHFTCSGGGGNFFVDIVICIVLLLIIYIVMPLLLQLVDFTFTLLGNVLFGWIDIDLDNHRSTAVFLGSLGTPYSPLSFCFLMIPFSPQTGIMIILTLTIVFYLIVGYIFWQRRKKQLFEEHKQQLAARLRVAPGMTSSQTAKSKRE